MSRSTGASDGDSPVSGHQWLPGASSASGAGLELIWAGKYDAQGERCVPVSCQPVLETVQRGDVESLMVLGDALDVAQALLPTHRGTVDLVYLDPPFNTGVTFPCQRPLGGRVGESVRVPGFADRWHNGASGFLAMLEPRLAAIHELLAPHGSLYLHLDPTIGHAARLVLDEVFGADCFQREIVWRIGWVSGFKTRVRNWIRNHDSIFFYTKDPRNFAFNKQYVAHRAGYRRRGEPGKQAGMPIEDVWNANDAEFALEGAASLDSIQIKSLSREKSGWATQKNESLVERIVAASSNPGDLVMDLFAGSGTTAVVAARLDRRFLAADASPVALQLARARLQRQSEATWPGEARVCATRATPGEHERRRKVVCTTLGLDDASALTEVDESPARAPMHLSDAAPGDAYYLFARSLKVSVSWLSARVNALSLELAQRIVVVADAFEPLPLELAGDRRLVRMQVAGAGWAGNDASALVIPLPQVVVARTGGPTSGEHVEIRELHWPKLGFSPADAEIPDTTDAIEGWRLMDGHDLRVLASSLRQPPLRDLVLRTAAPHGDALLLRIDDIRGGSQDLWIRSPP